MLLHQPPQKKVSVKKPPAPRATPGFGFANGSASANHSPFVSSGPTQEDYAELIEAAKATIPGYRADGPPLGFLFDDPFGVDPSLKRQKVVLDGSYAVSEGGLMIFDQVGAA